MIRSLFLASFAFVALSGATATAQQQAPASQPAAPKQAPPAQQPANTEAKPAPQKNEVELEQVAELKEGPGNIAVAGRRVILSMHPFYSPTLRVVEVKPDGSLAPFPNEQWARAPEKDEPDAVGTNKVLGIRADSRGVVWMLDHGGKVPKVVGWDTRKNKLFKVIPLPPPVTAPTSFHNDLAVDTVHDALFIADVGGGKTPAIVVVDIKTGQARRVLENHASVSPEDVPMVVDGKPVRRKNPDGSVTEPRLGINPIAIDPNMQWVYYGAMHGTSVYRVRTKDLLDAKLTPEQLGSRVERYGDKPVSDGIIVGNDGNVFITDVTANAIGVTSKDGKYRRIVQDERLSWPDGLAIGGDGKVYVTVNRLHRSANLNAGENESKPPYYVFRFAQPRAARR
ncbi:hypothetical protein HPC49_47310 [Pyxidicoccus fallax]|uniref:Major royal jelly protein n=1 Tax=Pyxidicoccus fallax TaxID=394095 RepID=A0A848LTN1_9BACT|nr:L-dopachrome tautomerase-related protein [Pyxidicoccus fallax]NMO21305.1 hypothetical protein [Pyxidicoccus fallax]NPC85786.1 hypothetical protein [Pyxidicoccus fallax]